MVTASCPITRLRSIGVIAHIDLLIKARCWVSLQGTKPRPGEVDVIRGQILLAETFGYVAELRSATQ